MDFKPVDTVDKKMKRKKHDAPTLSKSNASESDDMKVITIKKLTAKQKVKCFEIPHYALCGLQIQSFIVIVNFKK